MKTIFLILSLLVPAKAVQHTIEWDASMPGERVAQGYMLWERVSADATVLIATTDAETLKATGEFSPGQHTVFVTAFDELGQSDPSGTYTFTVVTRVLESSGDLGKWRVEKEFEEVVRQRRFYRVTDKP